MGTRACFCCARKAAPVGHPRRDLLGDDGLEGLAQEAREGGGAPFGGDGDR